PMIFFVVMGFRQITYWLVHKDRERLGLGLTLLFVAAMAKFEGFIFLALAGSWVLVVPSVWPSLRLTTRGGWGVAFWFFAALPFIVLRVQIPALHPESGWAGYALGHPGSALSNCLPLFLMLIARLFVSGEFACWTSDSGNIHWAGTWNGVSSLYNHS